MEENKQMSNKCMVSQQGNASPICIDILSFIRMADSMLSGNVKKLGPS